MRKFLSAFVGIVTLFTIGVGSVMALSPVFQPIQPIEVFHPAFNPVIPAVDCSVFGVCAVYVYPHATLMAPFPDGTKDNPYGTLGAAVSKVKSDTAYNTIILAGGTYAASNLLYPESFPYKFDGDVDSFFAKSINIHGGYSADFSTVDPEANPTILDAEGANGILDIHNLGGKVSGITFKNSESLFMMGISALEVENTSAATHRFTVEGNKFDSNSSSTAAGALFMRLTGTNSAVIEGNEFYNNDGNISPTVDANGDIEMYKNYFHSNNIDHMFECEDGAVVFNNYFVNNTVANDVIDLHGSCTFENNTIAENTVSGSTATDAVLAMESNGNVVVNNLIASNITTNVFAHVAGDNSLFEYNALDNSSDPSSLSSNNVNCDPKFSGSTGVIAKYVFGADSDCIDKGKSVIVAEDYFGASRPLNGDGANGAEFDPGAYEAPTKAAPGPGPGPGVAVPVISSFTVDPSTFSPNGDGTADTTAISFNLNVESKVYVYIETSAGVVMNKLLDGTTKSAGSVVVAWDGKNSANTVVSDATYKVKVKAENASGNDNEELSVVVNTSSNPPASDRCAGFKDVAKTNSSCDAITYVKSTGAMTGNPDGTFAPNNVLQRDQVAKISLETFNLFDSTKNYCNGHNPFTDVTKTAWAYEYVCRGVDLGMITGYKSGADAGFYRPARSVNRVEFLALILRNLNENMPSVNSTSYSDVPAGEWFSGYAKYAYDHSLFVGSKLNSTSFTTRVEVADVIYKLHEQGKV